MSKITPFIRCHNTENHNAHLIAEYYVQIFPGSKILSINPAVVTMEIFGREIALLNGDEHVSPNPSISLSLWIQDRSLTKVIYDALVAGGTSLMPFDEYVWSPAYGRCNDKFGVSRQVMYDDREEITEHALVPSIMYTKPVAGKAKDAMERYKELFPNSKIDMMRSYGESGIDVPDAPDHLAHAEFILDGQVFIASDSSADHAFGFDDGMSLMILTDGQDETDHYWYGLIADGGKPLNCGRCIDPYGVRWQVIPKQLLEVMADGDPIKAQYAAQKMMTMSKIVIEELYASV